MDTIASLTVHRLQRSAEEPVFYVPAGWRWEGCEPEGVLSGGDVPPGWRAYTGEVCLTQLSGLARRLHALGVDKGVPVAIVAETSHAWAACDAAIVCLGGITVGVYPNLPGDQVAYQVRHSEARVLLVEDQAQYEKIRPFLEDCEDLAHVLSMTPGAKVPQLLPAAPDLDFLRAKAAAVTPEDVCTYVYTSGTTGLPKGAVLTHGALIAVVRASKEALPLHPDDCSVVFLPMAHVLQRFAGYRGLAEDIVGYFALSLQHLPETLAAARPQVLATVPRMLEKIKATAEAKAAERGPRAAALLAWGIRVGKAWTHARRTGQSPSLSLRIQHAIASRIIYRKVRERMGGRLRMVASGGAALSVDVAEWFEALDIQICEAWGLTETCAPATLNTPAAQKLGTVGKPLPGVEVRLAEDGEVEVRGPGLFSGYLKDPEATAAVFTDDGFFRTGDLGEIDADGFLRIVDRKKEIIVTAGGKNIPPVNIEKKLEGGLLGQAVVIGSERPYLIGLFAADPEALDVLARDRGWTGDYAANAARPEVRAAFQERMDAVNATLARYETVKRFAVLPAPLTTETDELTPSLKLKRRVITQKYAALIDELYSG